MTFESQIKYIRKGVYGISSVKGTYEYTDGYDVLTVVRREVTDLSGDGGSYTCCEISPHTLLTLPIASSTQTLSLINIEKDAVWSMTRVKAYNQMPESLKGYRLTCSSAPNCQIDFISDTEYSFYIKSKDIRFKNETYSYKKCFQDAIFRLTSDWPGFQYGGTCLYEGEMEEWAEWEWQIFGTGKLTEQEYGDYLGEWGDFMGDLLNAPVWSMESPSSLSFSLFDDRFNLQVQ